MCGITGVWSTQQREGLRSIAEQMANAIMHRGPEDSGAWSDEAIGLALGHRRLSIVDLSAAGHQPMLSTSGRWVISFNGEIYNHQALRVELEVAGVSANWRGHSDTETLLAAFEFWGVETTLKRCVGMFAIALWDRETLKLTLARDRFGEKPLYFGWVGRNGKHDFVFGSELKALRAHPDFNSKVCRKALSEYIRLMYVPAPLSIYEGVFKLEPGCLLTVQGEPPTNAPKLPLSSEQRHGSIEIRRWWSLSKAIKAGAREPIRSDSEAVLRLDKTLSESVNLQSLADVPVGAFLSGGVDSSTIVALMQSHSMRPVKTYTIGFDEVGFDESKDALAVARHLGTEHFEMRVTSQMALDIIPGLPDTYDEPFSDSSQIPTYLVCQAARQQVTVALSGDAGDELFGGYNRYLWGPRLWRNLSRLPNLGRQALSQTLSSLPVDGWDSLSRPLGVVRLGEKMHKLSRALKSTNTLDDFYCSLVSEWQDQDRLVLGASCCGDHNGKFTVVMDDALQAAVGDDAALRMMYWDTMTYLPDDILCKVDRAAMATSLETRIPFLDHRVAELAWQLPRHMKIRNNVGKWALRQVLYKYVPSKLIERPKAGFAIPIGNWLRGPLRDWAENLINEQRLLVEGYFDPAPIRRAWSEHLIGKIDHSAKLWSILMFQAWLDKNG